MRRLKLKYYRLRAKSKKPEVRDKYRLKWYRYTFKNATWNIVDTTGFGWSLEVKSRINDVFMGEQKPQPVLEHNPRVCTFVQEDDGLVYVHMNGTRSPDHNGLDGNQGLDRDFATRLYGEKSIEWNNNENL